MNFLTAAARLDPLARRRRRRHDAAAADAVFRWHRAFLRDDVLALGESLAGLDAAATDAAGAHLERAVEAQARARKALAAARDEAGLDVVRAALVEGRRERACAEAVRAGSSLPGRSDECFFDPQHGPASGDAEWTPQHGTARSVQACPADLARLASGEAPAVRLVRVGDRRVPLHGVTDADLTAQAGVRRIRSRSVSDAVDIGVNRARLKGAENGHMPGGTFGGSMQSGSGSGGGSS